MQVPDPSQRAQCEATGRKGYWKPALIDSPWGDLFGGTQSWRQRTKGHHSKWGPMPPRWWRLRARSSSPEQHLLLLELHGTPRRKTCYSQVPFPEKCLLSLLWWYCPSQCPMGHVQLGFWGEVEWHQGPQWWDAPLGMHLGLRIP